MIPSPNQQRQQRPIVNTSSGVNGIGHSFINVHQPSARSPLSQESSPFSQYRQRNLSTGALPANDAPATPHKDSSALSSSRSTSAAGGRGGDRAERERGGGAIITSNASPLVALPAAAPSTSSAPTPKSLVSSSSASSIPTAASLSAAATIAAPPSPALSAAQSVPALSSAANNTTGSPSAKMTGTRVMPPSIITGVGLTASRALGGSHANSSSDYLPSYRDYKPATSYSPTNNVLPPLPPPKNNSSSNLSLTGGPNSPRSSSAGQRPLSAQQQYGAQYYAWWDYLARDHDELSFKKGDLLLAMREFDDLWCLGAVMKPDKRSSVRHGFFPLQFCSCESQCLVVPSSVATRKALQLPPYANGAEPGSRLSVQYPYAGTSSDELTLRPGNQVRVMFCFDDGWVLGEQIDHAGATLAIGVFPMAVSMLVKASAAEAYKSKTISSGSQHQLLPLQFPQQQLSSQQVSQSQQPLQQLAPSQQQQAAAAAAAALVPTQDIGLFKSGRQREGSNNSGKTLYHTNNNSSHYLNLVKQPSSPTSPPFLPSQPTHRNSPPIGAARSPLSGLAGFRGTAGQGNRSSIQSTHSGLSYSGHVSDDQVIRALQDRPAQDSILQLYLSQKGDPNLVDSNGHSLLHLAIIAQSQACLVFLLSAPGIKLEYGSNISPLYTAVRFKSWKAAQQLLILGANPNACDENGISVLQVVLLLMVNGDALAEAVVQLLCETQADVNHLTKDKRTIPLAIAVDRGLWAEAEILLAYGANPYLIWTRDRRLSTSTTASGVFGAPLTDNTAAYLNDPLWDAVNANCVHLVRLLLKFFYYPTSFTVRDGASSSSSASPSSTQSGQSFFGPQHPSQNSPASSLSASNSVTNVNTIPGGNNNHTQYTNTSQSNSNSNSNNNNNNSSLNGHHPGNSSTNVNGAIPMPYSANSAGGGSQQHQPLGPSTPPSIAPSIPSPSSAQSSPGSAAFISYMNRMEGGQNANNHYIPSGGSAMSSPVNLSAHSHSLSSSTTATVVEHQHPQGAGIYIITPKILLQALTLAKDLGHNECLQALSRPELALKEGSLFGTGSNGYGSLYQLGYGGGHHGNGLVGNGSSPFLGHHYHGSSGGVGGGSGKEHRNLIQKLAGLFK